MKYVLRGEGYGLEPRFDPHRGELVPFHPDSSEMFDSGRFRRSRFGPASCEMVWSVVRLIGRQRRVSTTKREVLESFGLLDAGCLGSK